jgi:PilZ domain-containing protein
VRVAAELTNVIPPRERKSKRTGVRMWAGYREGSGRGTVAIIDMSPTGAKIESHLTLYPNSLIWLKLPGLEAWQARIAWVNKHEAGCEFVRPLHPAVFDRVVEISQN